MGALSAFLAGGALGAVPRRGGQMTADRRLEPQVEHDSTAEPGQTEGRMLRRITLAASMGSLIEYFDLVVYGALATVLSRVFFAGTDETARLLETFAVFALAF